MVRMKILREVSGTHTREKKPLISLRHSACNHRSSEFKEKHTKKKLNFPIFMCELSIGIAENTLECLDAYQRFSGKGTFLSAYDPEIDGLEF